MRKSIVLASTAVLLGGLVDMTPTPAKARDNFGAFVGGAIAGAAIGGLLGGMANQGRNSRGARSKRGGDDGARDSRSSGDRDAKADDRVLATLGPPSQQRQAAILKSLDPNGDVGAVGTKSVLQIGVTSSSESERDDTKPIDDIITRFKNEQSKSNVAGDVTAHAIEQSLTRAFKDSKLDTFESFVGENWSAERIRVMILDRVKGELDQLFRGNNRGNAPMDDLDQLIRQSAQLVYHRLFEISELLAANRSTTLFMQRLYQTQGNLVDDQLRESTDRMLGKTTMVSVVRFESLLRRDEDGVALRYRAARIVLDCLSENVARITSSETGIATVGEIEQKIGRTAMTECATWLEYQFGSDKSQLKAQKPMPLRAVWSSSGPKDDASMYGRVSNAL